MKKFRYVGWASACVALLILILAFIDFFVKAKLFPVAHGTSYFILANSFFLLAITIFVATKDICCEGKDDKKV